MVKLPSVRVSREDKARMNRALALFIRARIPIADALDLLAESNPKFAAPLAKVRRSVERGNSLSSAMRRESSAFGEVTAQLIQIGERTGNISEMAEVAATHEERRHDLQRQLKSAMAYPALIVVVSFLAIGALLVFVVPIFETTFKSFGADLPRPTRILISVSQFVIANLVWICAAFLCSAVAARSVRYHFRVRQLLEKLQLSTPVFGRVCRNGIASRFCQTASTMLLNGIPLAETLRYLRAGENSIALQNEIDDMYRRVERGSPVVSGRSTSLVLPEIVVSLMQTGQESGNLGEALGYLGDYLQREVESSVSVITSVIEPLLILFIGLVVGAILVTLYLPIFEMSSVVM